MGNVMHRGKGSFTHVENTVFFDRSLSLKAKGIYCQIRSLEGNPEWVFTIRGFASLVRDGVDAVTAGIKELEEAGYIIRARKRSENGRFLKAEEATWITLDDPAMHAAVSEELRAEGFAVLSEFSRSAAQAAGEAGAEDRVPEKAQVVPRTGKSVSGPPAPGKAASGKARSGKARSGETAAINYSSDGKRKDDKRLSPSLPTGAAAGEKGGREPFEPYRKGEFPKAFERLCSLSLKPVTSLRFKRDCREAWQRKVESGFEPGQIAEAYAAYARDYWVRNGDDARLAKNLLRWLEGEDGLAAWADEPVAPDVLGCDGEPLGMSELAEADPAFGKLWRKVVARRNVVRSLLYDEKPDATEDEVAERCAADRLHGKYLAACEERYGRYLSLCGMLSGEGTGRRAAS